MGAARRPTPGSCPASRRPVVARRYAVSGIAPPRRRPPMAKTIGTYQVGRGRLAAGSGEQIGQQSVTPFLLILRCSWTVPGQARGQARNARG